MQQPYSDGVLLAVIEKGLDSLGETPKQAIWFYLEQTFGFSKKNIPENIDVFQDALQKCFGLGYGFLDTLFRRYLEEVIGQNLEGYSSFAECVNVLRLKPPLAPINQESLEGAAFGEH